MSDFFYPQAEWQGAWCCSEKVGEQTKQHPHPRVEVRMLLGEAGHQSPDGVHRREKPENWLKLINFLTLD